MNPVAFQAQIIDDFIKIPAQYMPMRNKTVIITIFDPDMTGKQQSFSVAERPKVWPKAKILSQPIHKTNDWASAHIDTLGFKFDRDTANER
ncbi:MAG: hypothetical protein LBM77_02185 [Spirochaetaceae bacterium]|jgi:hypothetical protein|nr:hypothetical protein [Spirochaetaceae bacterium]